jgi:phage N-6-adenine-methyltransferase
MILRGKPERVCTVIPVVQNVNFHPVADIFPLMQGREFDDLVSDVRANGLRQPIITHENQIIDGRNRYRACIEAEVEPWFEEWDGNGDLTAFVVSLNIHRRHLDESQRAMVAAKLASMRLGGNQHSEGMPIGRASELLNVGSRNVARAREVIDRGEPELVQAVERGDVAVSTAAEIAALPATIQKEAVERIEAGQKPAQVKRDLSPLMSSESDQWNTPKAVVELVKQMLGEIDLDPCSNDGKANVPAKKVYRREDDGLQEKWKGRVYMNPPYGDVVGDWVSKLIAEYEAGNVKEAIALVAARVDTKWFQTFEPYNIGFVRGRLTFGDAKNSATFPSAVIYFGERPTKFRVVFADLCWFPNRGANGK